MEKNDPSEGHIIVAGPLVVVGLRVVRPVRIGKREREAVDDIVIGDSAVVVCPRAEL